ncbi:MAG TPA: MFS transporter [Candidatus Dormibacteraeota bacterium]|nr:MFS transporter [Candidatus Dormibacteraeota bacterium]
MALMFCYGLVYAWGVVAPEVESVERWPALLVAAVLSGNPVGWSIGVVLGGRLADRHRPRMLCCVAVAMLATGFGIAFAFPSPASFIAGYGVLGLGMGGGFAITACLAAIREVMPQRLGAASGAMTSCYALAALVEVPLVSRLDVAVGWLDALRVVGAALLAICVIAVAVMPSLPKPTSRVADRRPARELVLEPRLIAACLLALSIPPVGAGAFSHLGTYSALLHMTPVVATASLVAVAIGNFTGRFSGGALSDRMGADQVMVLALLFDVAAAIALSSASGPVALLAGGLLAGAAFGVAYGALPRLAATIRAGAGANFVYGLVSIGFAAGTFAGPLLVAGAGAGRTSWLFAAAAVVVGGAIVVLRRTILAGPPATSRPLYAERRMPP